MRKKRRRTARQLKTARVAPRLANGASRPANGALRPLVQCPMVRYNSRRRLGRGSTLKEIKEADMPQKLARTVGVAVDHRRRNRSVEGFQRNVQRLRE